LNPVTLTKIRADETVKVNRTRIEAKEIQPPDISNPRKLTIVSVSMNGLKIPTMMANGETTSTLLSMNPDGIPPADSITTGKTKKGIRAETEYLSKEITERIKTSVTNSFAKGAIR